MPHVIVKMFAGRSEQQKQDLADAIARDVVEIAKCDPAVVSVAVVDFDKDDWPEAVYRPDIMGAGDTLFRAPGYNPFE
jgi:4-oxalocrotonate tautomerase